MERSSKAIWAQRVAQWRASSLTRAEFAASQGVNAGTLKYWTWRLKREAQGTPAATSREAQKSRDAVRRKVPKAPAATPTFLEFPVVTVDSPRLEVVLPHGATVRVAEDFDAATLGRLLDVLESRA